MSYCDHKQGLSLTQEVEEELTTTISPTTRMTRSVWRKSKRSLFMGGVGVRSGGGGENVEGGKSPMGGA